MKILNIVLTVTFLSSQTVSVMALASPKNNNEDKATNAAPVSPPEENSQPASIKITPSTLRAQLLENNLSLIQSLNSVHDAKDQVSVARDSLFPSLNLGALFSSASSSFLLSSVQFLLPFLLPSTWFNYHAQKDTFVADEYSYQVLELNTYSSALALYLTIAADQQTQLVYEQEYTDLKKIYDLESKLVELGTASANDILPAKAQSDLAGIQSSNVSQLVEQDIASLRQALGLPLSTKITLVNTNIPPSPWEKKTIQAAVDEANAVAPEGKQIQYLVDAAKGKKWSTIFSFINSATLSSQVNPGVTIGTTGASLSNLNSIGSFSIGPALFPEIRIASRNISEVALLQTQLVQSNTQILESAMEALKEAQSQLNLATQAEAATLQAYNTKYEEYTLGFATLTDLLVTRTQETDSQIARVSAQLNLNLQRVTLHRTLLTDQFSLVKGCNLSSPPQSEKGKSLDQLCREGDLTPSNK